MRYALRFAKRSLRESQCPTCKKKYAVRSIGLLGEQEIYACRFCDWMPRASRDRLKAAKQNAAEKAATTRL